MALIALARGWIPFYWLLRCTVPQFSVARQKVLVPVIACLFVNTAYQWFCYLSIAILYHIVHTFALVNATSADVLAKSPPKTPI